MTEPEEPEGSFETWCQERGFILKRWPILHGETWLEDKRSLPLVMNQLEEFLYAVLFNLDTEERVADDVNAANLSPERFKALFGPGVDPREQLRLTRPLTIGTRTFLLSPSFHLSSNEHDWVLEERVPVDRLDNLYAVHICDLVFPALLLLNECRNAISDGRTEDAVLAMHDAKSAASEIDAYLRHPTYAELREKLERQKRDKERDRKISSSGGRAPRASVEQWQNKLFVLYGDKTHRKSPGEIRQILKENIGSWIDQFGRSRKQIMRVLRKHFPSHFPSNIRTL
jgi:hypothetical protein